MIQEAQEDLLSSLEIGLDGDYLFEFAPNNSSLSTETNGLLTLIRWKCPHASQIQVINGILDSERGEAILIVSIPSKNRRLVNVHLTVVIRFCTQKLSKVDVELYLVSMTPYPS